MIFGQGFGTAPTTPEGIERKRAMIAALMPRFGQARYVGEGLGHIATGVAIGRQNRKLDEAEKTGREGARARLEQMLGLGGGEARGTPFNPTGATSTPAVSTRPLDPNAPENIGADTMAALFKTGLEDRGIPSHVADAFVMNARDESGLRTDINEQSPLVPGSRGGYGMLQWTGPRRRALEAFAESQGKPVSDMGVQMDFLVSELQGPEARAGREILSSKDAPSAAVAIVNDFLRPAPEHRERRANAYSGGQGGGQGYSGPSQQELMLAMSDPWLDPSQKAVLGQMLQQAQQANDPMRALELEKAQIELERLRNPQADVPEAVRSREMLAQRAGLQPGTPEYSSYMATGNLPKPEGEPEAVRALRIRAEAAGLQPGTPEYQAFMMNGGKVENGMVIESDGQGGFRMIQGSGAGAAAGKPFTEGQSKDIVFATRARGALEAFEPVGDAMTSRKDRALDWVPLGLGREGQGDEFQVAQNAGNEFLQAILRKDTGAAITRDEQVLYGETYIPQPGDGAAVLDAKRSARLRAVEALEAGMSPAQILAQERALGAIDAARGQGAAPAESDADGWTTLPNGVRVREAR